MIHALTLWDKKVMSEESVSELCLKSRLISPHSGRMMIAQQFTAGIKSGGIVVREADG